ncbi:MAG: Nramp family divalent metal transporter [Planctomycetaceae bacterium]|nr:Nramp family divalent metal transporter [Planctomycetaceae bacterium]
MAEQPRSGGLLNIIGPGILVAATGVGAGDLATAAFAGSRLHLAVLWVVPLGALLKFVLNEGLARWQLSTGTTLLEGGTTHLGRLVQFVFLAYLLLWSFFVGSALMSACGATAHAILPLFNPKADRVVYGLLHSLVAVILVRRGGYRLFERVMAVCIAVMVLTVIVTVIATRPDWGAVASGLFIPRINTADPEALRWSIALMGGVGGTLTVLCYGYWIREEGWQGREQLRTCRIDLATGYAMTALFGVGMVILGNGISFAKKESSTRLIVLLAEHLETALGSFGPYAKWAFLVGSWGAVASSLLGVWQSVPYLFADFRRLTSRSRTTTSQQTTALTEQDQQSSSGLTATTAYRRYLYGLACIPALGLWFDFRQVQKYYAIIGAAFIPLLAIVLLVLNGRWGHLPREDRNSWLTDTVLIVAILFSAIAGWYEVAPRFQ